MSAKKTLEGRVAALEARNKRVEADKAWETSWTRTFLLMAISFMVVWCYLRYIAHDTPWKDAILAALGISVSTLTIQIAKNKWLQRYVKNK